MKTRDVKAFGDSNPTSSEFLFKSSTKTLFPTLSIIIPCYNYGHYLGESIESVLAQDYRDYELIIIDDASTDHTPDVIHKYASHHPQISFHRHQKNRGVFEANITGINLAKGSYIHLFSADDRYLPGFLSNSMGLLLEHPEIPFVCTDIAYFKDDQSHFSKEVHLLKMQKPTFFEINQIVSLFQTTPFWVPGATCVIKKEILKRYGGGLDPILENISDWFFFHQIALLEGVGYVPEIGVAMRQHSLTYTSQVKRDKKRTRATYWNLLKKLSKKENRQLFILFKKSALLTFIFEALRWKLWIRPKYWGFIPYLLKKSSLLQLLVHVKKR